MSNFVEKKKVLAFIEEFKANRTDDQATSTYILGVKDMADALLIFIGEKDGTSNTSTVRTEHKPS